jgi:hypothetical protein
MSEQETMAVLLSLKMALIGRKSHLVEGSARMGAIYSRRHMENTYIGREGRSKAGRHSYDITLQARGAKELSNPFWAITGGCVRTLPNGLRSPYTHTHHLVKTPGRKGRKTSRTTKIMVRVPVKCCRLLYRVESSKPSQICGWEAMDGTNAGWMY